MGEKGAQFPPGPLKNMENKDNNTNKPLPPPIKDGETILEYSIRISGDKRTPDQVKEDSEKVGTLPKINITKKKGK